MIRKIVMAMVLVPLAIVIVAFAVANRRSVVVSFDPFDPTDPALSVAVPLYALILALVVCGVVVGGTAAWLRQGRWRGRARTAESQASALMAENDLLRRRDPGAPPPAPLPVGPGARLSIPPPAGSG